MNGEHAEHYDRFIVVRFHNQMARNVLVESMLLRSFRCYEMLKNFFISPSAVDRNLLHRDSAGCKNCKNPNYFYTFFN